jgi:hypothetical protein
MVLSFRLKERRGEVFNVGQIAGVPLSADGGHHVAEPADQQSEHGRGEADE